MLVVDECKLIDAVAELADIPIDLLPEIELLLGRELRHFPHFAEIASQRILLLLLSGMFLIQQSFFRFFRDSVKIFAHGSSFPLRRRGHDRKIIFL